MPLTWYISSLENSRIEKPTANAIRRETEAGVEEIAIVSRSRICLPLNFEDLHLILAFSLFDIISMSIFFDASCIDFPNKTV